MFLKKMTSFQVVPLKQTPILNSDSEAIFLLAAYLILEANEIIKLVVCKRIDCRPPGQVFLCLSRTCNLIYKT